MLITLPERLAKLTAPIATIDSEETRRILSSNNAVLIDVREPSEFDAGHATGAVNIPRGVIEMQMLAKYPDADQSIVLYCATGARAKLSAEQLFLMGYTNIAVVTDDAINNL